MTKNTNPPPLDERYHASVPRWEGWPAPVAVYLRTSTALCIHGGTLECDFCALPVTIGGDSSGIDLT